MAIVLGTSGAWKDVLRMLDGQSDGISHPKEIEPRLRSLKKEYPEKVSRLSAEFDQEAERMVDQLDRDKELSGQAVAARFKAVGNDLLQIYERIAVLRREKGHLAKIRGWFETKRLTYRIAGLRREEDHFINSQKSAIETKEREVESFKARKTQILCQRTHHLDDAIDRLEQALSSKELAGADAEIETINHLQKLPKDHYVLNDVRLQIDRFIRFNGAVLQSAQIDHVVASPAGVFVIEAKHWSQDFVDSQQYFSPFDQVARSRFLCHVLLREHVCDAKVRSIVASRGKLPEKREEDFVKVLKPHELNGYITWFKERPLEPETIARVKVFLAGYLG